MKYTKLAEKLSLCLLVLLCGSGVLSGQDIAPIPSDPAVTQGQLPNGLRWYVARNTDIQGVADFALVQMTGARTVQSVGRETVSEIAREALLSQPLLTAPSVQDFFIRKGCVPGPEGFAQVQDNATVFRFGNVNMKLDGSVLDSTLFVLMNIAGRFHNSDDPVVRKWYVPSDQAIIVAGDVDANTISQKLHMLSFMYPPAESVRRAGYMWEDRKGIETKVDRIAEPGLAKVSAEWRLERTPRELMNTIQPAIQEKYLTMAGMVAEQRLLKYFRSVNIPVASVSSRYIGGSGTLGDGLFSVEVVLAAEDAQEAVSAVADVLASIDAYGVAPAEALKASLDFVDKVAQEGRMKSVGNREYVNRCVSAFIHNTALSSKESVLKFYTSKDLSADTECKLLHSVASAVLDSGRNLTLKYASDSLRFSEDSLKNIFGVSWLLSQNSEPAESPLSAVPHLPVPGSKIKVKSSSKEYLSGGSVWTLSNGMVVIVKNMPAGGQINYSLSLNGGTGSIEGLGVDDGTYLEDYLRSCMIGGMPGQEFKDAVRSRGMKLAYEVGHSATKFEGSVPAEKLDYMVRVLLTLLNERTPCPEEWEYYRKGEPLRQASGVASGNGVCLTDDFAAKAEAFFKSLSDKVNNGVLILVGDIDEKNLKEVLTMYAGGFRTTEKSFRRTETFSRNFIGMEGYHRPSSENSVTVALTAPMALTSENYYTAAVTSMVLRRHFALMLSGKGMRVDVSYDCRRFPQESLLMRVTISEASVEGLAEGTSGYRMGDALSVLRKVYSDIADIGIDANSLASYKFRVEKRLALEKQSPEYWINAFNLRYLDGKDFTTGAEAKIRAISDASVRAMLSTLAVNSKVEYVITGK